MGSSEFPVAGLDGDLAQELMRFEQFMASAQEPAKFFDGDLRLVRLQHGPNFFHVFVSGEDARRVDEFIACAVSGLAEANGVGRAAFAGLLFLAFFWHLFALPEISGIPA